MSNKRPFESYGKGGGGRPGSGAPRSQAATSTQRLTTNDALTYLREVKERFKDNKAVYDQFLEIMKQFKAQNIDTSGVIVQVKTLFKGHRELILGFNTFLPKGYEIQLAEDLEEPKPVEFDQAISYVNKIKNRFQSNERVYKAFLEILNMYRKEEKGITEVYEEVAQLFKHHQDLLEEFTHFLPDSSPPQPFMGRGQQKRPAQSHRAPVKQVVKARKTGRGADEGAQEFEPRSKAASFAKELQFFERVKQRLRNRDVYQEFLKCLNIFNQDIITKMELRGLVYDVLGKYPDLLSGFDDFLARCESVDLDVTEGGRGKDGNKLTAKDMAKMKIIAAREKFLSRPISELDLSACERCGPSYRLLPKNFPKAAASARTELCNQVLNDNWVSVTSGSEDFSFKAMRKNQYEESLFRCEDDRFEMDMIIETNSSVIEALQPVQARLASLSAEERSAFKLPEGALTAVHLRCVERIYGNDHGSDLRDLLARSPACVVPVVLKRLQQKDKEWRKVREDMQKVWGDVYEKNIYKSLDHRSFYFKQADKKSLSAKGMLAEIREISDKRRLAEEGPLLASARNTSFSSFDQEFTYLDRAVHDDVYSIIKFSSDEMMNTDQAEKLMGLWRRFVEPLFGVRRAGAENHGLVDSAAEAAAVAVAEEAKKEELAQRDGNLERAAAGDKAAAAAEEGGAGGAADMEAEKVDSRAGDAGTEKPERGAAAAAAGLEDMVDAGAEAGGSDAEEEEEEIDEEMADRAGEDDDDETDHEALGRTYAACKPLASAVLEEAGVEGSSDTPLSAREGSVFYANDSIYLLLRLHQHLYERLVVARQSATLMARQTGETATEKHCVFLRLLFRLLNGRIEPTKYEDECRTLLGANSYVLFTLDKLIYKVVKQAQSVLNDSTAAKLLQLHSYEAARLAPYRDSVYHANACVLLHDEACFRIVARSSGTSLGIQLLEGGSDKGTDVPSGMIEASFAAYLRQLMQTPAGSQKKVFLRRNLAKAAPGSDLAAAVKGVRMMNGLEAKLSCSNSKVSYVLDTEDILYRPQHRALSADAAAAASARRAKKFQGFVSKASGQ